MKAGLCFFVLLLAFFPPLFFSACSRFSKEKEAPAESALSSPSGASGFPAWQALAVLKTGEYPIWFEFSQDGPRRIPSPSEAALTDLEPWPLSRFAAGMLISGSDLVVAVNREGFLIFSPEDEKNSVTLYSASSGGRWDPYTVASVFTCEDKPAVLLYRDDFFRNAAAPKMEPQVELLDKNNPKPAGIALAALESLPKDEGWEADALWQDSGGVWYYRFVQTGKAKPQTAYYRAEDLSLPGEKIGAGDYRASSMPESGENAPPAAAPLIAEAPSFFSTLRGKPVLRMISPDFHGARFFSSLPFIHEEEAAEPAMLFGYCGKEASFVLDPDGRGLASGSGVTFPFSLPSLPEGFVYTAAGLAGDVLIACWEEQEESAVGAAGFMALYAETRGL